MRRVSAPPHHEPHLEHRIYPYLLRDQIIDRPNQVWCANVTYIPLQSGFLYLVVILDWYSRKVLFWRLSNTLESEFCVEALTAWLMAYSSSQRVYSKALADQRDA